MTPDDPRERSTRAAEYALGTLDGAERRQFESLLADDAALRREVERWEASLYRLVDALPEREPPATLWSRVNTAIDAGTASEAVQGAPGPTRRGLWASLPFWRGWSLLATAASVLLAFLLVLAPASSPVTYVVVVTDDARSQASWAVSGRADAPEIRVRALTPQSLPEGRVFQLWVLPAGASKVRSVALIPASGDAQLRVSDSLADMLADAQKFGVSIEPPGGSPTGQPTTTPLYHGKPMAI